MGLKHNTVEYSRKLNDKDELFMDAGKADSYKNKIDSALKGLVQDYKNIEKAYKKLANDKSTKGIYKENAQAAQKAAKNRETYCTNRRTELKNAINKDAQTYTINTMGKELDSLRQTVADLQKAAADKDAQ